MSTKIQVTFHGVTYSDSLDSRTATVADVRKIAAVGCKQPSLPEDKYAVYCCGLRVEDTDLLADLGVFDKFSVEALVPVVGGRPSAYIKVEQFDGRGSATVKVEQGGETADPKRYNNEKEEDYEDEGRGGDVKPKIAGLKRGRVGDMVVSSAARAEFKIDRKLWQDGEGSRGTSTTPFGGGEGAQSIQDNLEYQEKAQELLDNGLEFNFIVGTLAVNTGRKVPGSDHENDRIYDWFVYVRDQNNRDLSKVISKVKFKLHATFEQSRRVKILEKPPFQLQEEGWGQFDIFVSIFIRGVEKPLEYAKLLCFGRPLPMAHVIPPHPPRDEPVNRFPNTEPSCVNEEIQQVTILNPSPSLASGLRTLLPLPPIATTAPSDGKRPGGIVLANYYKDIYQYALKEHSKEHPFNNSSALVTGGGGEEAPDDEKEYRYLCKIRDELRAINAERRAKTEYDMTTNRAHFFEMAFKEELRASGGVAAVNRGGGGGLGAAGPVSSSPIPQGGGLPRF